MAYRKEIATGAIVEESCCTATTSGTTATSCGQTFTLSLKAGESVILRNTLSVPATIIPTATLSNIDSGELQPTIDPDSTYTITNTTSDNLPLTEFTWICIYSLQTSPGTYTVDNSGAYKNNSNASVDVIINTITYNVGTGKGVLPLTAGMTYTIV